MTVLASAVAVVVLVVDYLGTAPGLMRLPPAIITNLILALTELIGVPRRVLYQDRGLLGIFHPRGVFLGQNFRSR